jgi:FkbM family methyltransferase
MNLAHWVRVVRHHPRPLRLMAARALQFSGLSPLLTIHLDDYDLRFYPTNTSANLWINPHSRFHDLSLFRDYCRPGDTVADVGANIGEVSIVLSRGVGAHGRVFSFEPHPRIFTFLTGNLALNDCANVTARNMALGAEPGMVRMSDDKEDDMNRVVRAGAIEVPCSTLDAELPPGPIALLKVDVEGFELSVLKGGRQALARTACVNCELIDEHCHRNGYQMGDVVGLLRQSGFHGFIAGGARSLRAVDASFSQPGAHELIAMRDPSDFATRTGWSIV